MRRLALVFVALAPCAWADRVVLKSGGTLSGIVVERDATRVLLDVGPGRIGIPMARVERIESGISPLAAFREQAARIAPGDADAWAALGVWARERGMETQARSAFEMALQADPGHSAAHRALGHVRSEDAWLTLEESYRARGLVPFEGGWVTPAEMQALLQQRANSEALDRSRREAEARAREAEARAEAAAAEARRAENARTEEDGLPYWWVFAGGGCSGFGCGHGHGGHPHTPPPHTPAPPPAPEPVHRTGTMR